MPSVRAEDRQVVALVVSDLHLCHTPPACRALEEDWYETQRGYLKQIADLQYEHQVPVLIPGDIFDRWDSPAELINLALTHFPERAYGIPGQHDLASHVYEDIRKSAYWSLVKGGRLTNVEPGFPVTVEGASPIRLWGFPWGKEIEILTYPHTLYLEVALVHRYLWSEAREETSYEGAPESLGLSIFRKKITGYDAVFVGDNHVPFISTKQQPIVVNVGNLYRRNVTQKDYEPRVWLYYSDNTVRKHCLDISKDVFTDPRKYDEVKIGDKDLARVLEDLKEAKTTILSFEEVVERYLKGKNVKDEVRKMILCSLEEER